MLKVSCNPSSLPKNLMNNLMNIIVFLAVFSNRSFMSEETFLAGKNNHLFMFLALKKS